MPHSAGADLGADLRADLGRLWNLRDLRFFYCQHYCQQPPRRDQPWSLRSSKLALTLGAMLMLWVWLYGLAEPLALVLELVLSVQVLSVQVLVAVKAEDPRLCFLRLLWLLWIPWLLCGSGGWSRRRGRRERRVGSSSGMLIAFAAVATVRLSCP